MAMKGHIPAGGLKSRNVVEPRIRTGSGSREVRPSAAGQIGESQGSHVTRQGDTGYRGEVLYGGRGMNPVPYGNQVALNVGPGGCGTGRTLYGQAGSQGTHGPVAGAPKPQGRPILSEYGPDYHKPRS
jgi:hypothetical protein